MCFKFIVTVLATRSPLYVFLGVIAVGLKVDIYNDMLYIVIDILMT